MTNQYQSFDIAPIAQMQIQAQMAQAAAQQAYLRERMNLLEIPEMRYADERARHQLALQYMGTLAEQTGWVVNMDQLDFLYNPDNGGRGTSAQDWSTAMQGATPTLAMQEQMANPRYMASNLMKGGMTAEAAGATMRSMPLISGLINSAQTPVFQTPTSTGQNPAFQFIGGNQVGAREGLNILNDPIKTGLTSSAASFSAQDPDAWWNDFQRSLPKGEVAGATTYA